MINIETKIKTKRVTLSFRSIMVIRSVKKSGVKIPRVIEPITLLKKVISANIIGIAKMRIKISSGIPFWRMCWVIEFI